MSDAIAFQDIPFNASFPEELKAIVAQWTSIHKSPYSLSLYNTPDKTWDHTPLGSLRVSDHWNFKDSTGSKKIHCPTRGERPRNGAWTLAEWDGEAYVVLATYQRVSSRRDRKAARAAKGII
jgi:hypothetical protein